MAKGISIGVASDTREFTQGVKTGVIKPLEDAEKALEQVAKAGDKSGDKLERSFDDARKATSDFKREQTELGQAMARASEKGGSSFKRNVTESTKAGSRDLEEFGNEAKQNAAETFSSFDGSAQSLVDGIQGTFGGIVSSLGPMGAALGAAGAIGIGFISAAFSTAAEDEEAFKQKVADLATEFIETGQVGEASIQGIADRIKTMATVTDGSEKNLKDLRKAADDSGSSYKDLAQAYAGNTSGLKELWREGQRRLAQIREEQQENNTNSVVEKGLSVALSDRATAQKQYNDYLGQSLGVAREAATEAENYAAAGGAEMAAKAQLIQNVNDAYDDAAGSVDDYVNAETGVFDTDKYIAAMDAKQQALRDYQQNLVTFGGSLGPTATAYLESLGTDQASVLLDSYKNASTAQQTELAGIWAEAGKTNSAGYMTNLKNGLPATVPGPTVVLGVDDTAVERKKRELANSPFTIPGNFVVRGVKVN